MTCTENIRNSFSIAIVDTLSLFVLFVGKLFGTALTTGAAVLMMQVLGRDVAVFSVAAVCVTSYLTFDLFTKILSVGIDTGN